MKLHHAAAKPDWELLKPSQHNTWQRAAARTNGVLTPGNAASAAGVCLVGAGLGYVYAGTVWAGLALVAAGRLCDILDGMLADRTDTKSPLGEAVDATLDKIATFATLVVFAASGVMPWPLALLIGLQNGATGSLALAAKGLGRTVHPAAAGKIGGAVEWLALLSFGLGYAVHGSSASAIIAVAYALALIAILLNLLAATRYAQALHK